VAFCFWYRSRGDENPVGQCIPEGDAQGSELNAEHLASGGSSPRRSTHVPFSWWREENENPVGQCIPEGDAQGSE